MKILIVLFLLFACGKPPREKDLLSNEILGLSYGVGKKALENYMSGDQDSLEDLIEVAADKNETTPEHIRELVGEIFL